MLIAERPCRPLFQFLAYSGLRIGEALRLCWADLDFDAELVRVHRQLSRQREHRPSKTEAGRRKVILAPAVVKLMRERWLASPYKRPAFANTLGRGLDYPDVGEASAQPSNAQASSPPAGSRCGTVSPRC